ncbi:MAG: hypothetical protein DRJ42_20190 [Deltaproteobacteria bacterium]|nr:MAG: hypothetical protein DRJ42_20190 [Deltaproteobacteria bacterium]
MSGQKKKRAGKVLHFAVTTALLATAPAVGACGGDQEMSVNEVEPEHHETVNEVEPEPEPDVEATANEVEPEPEPSHPTNEPAPAPE